MGIPKKGEPGYMTKKRAKRDRRVMEKRIAKLLMLVSQPVGGLRDLRIARVLARLRRDGRSTGPLHHLPQRLRKMMESDK